MRSQKLAFQSTDGHTLSGRLDLPLDGEPIAFALFAHCFTCSKNLKAVGQISQALTTRKIAVLRFDFTGLGESEGDFADTNFTSNVSDLISAAEHLAEHHKAPKILIGHSLGGAAVLQAAGEIPSSLAVVTIGAPCDPAHVAKNFALAREEIETEGEAEVMLAGRNFKIKKQFLDDLEMNNMKDRIRNLRKALLVFHSPIDATVGVENAAHIFQNALHPKSFISLDTADHLLTDESDASYVGAVLAAWVEKYLETPQEKEKASALAAEKDLVVVKTGPEGYYTEVMANGHPLIADEPISFGGTNKGPSPYELLSASLGACTTMTLRMYADRKQWPLESVIVRLKHHKIHAKDCADCASSTGKIDVIERELEIFGPLDDEQKQRLLEIADKCPVHRTLHSEIKVETRLK